MFGGIYIHKKIRSTFWEQFMYKIASSNTGQVMRFSRKRWFDGIALFRWSDICKMDTALLLLGAKTTCRCEEKRLKKYYTLECAHTYCCIVDIDFAFIAFSLCAGKIPGTHLFSSENRSFLFACRVVDFHYFTYATFIRHTLYILYIRSVLKFYLHNF